MMAVVQNEKQKLAPSFAFITQKESDHHSIPNAFLSKENAAIIDDIFGSFNGLDPQMFKPELVQPIQPPFDKLERAVERLPSACKDNKWDEFVETLPALPIEELLNEDLSGANMCIAMIAHAVVVFGEKEISPIIFEAWESVTKRLKRKGPCLLSHDILENNFKLQHEKLNKNIGLIDNAWNSARCVHSTSGTSTERNLLTMVFSASLAARALPSAIASCQQATIDMDHDMIRSSLLAIVKYVEVMLKGFLSGGVQLFCDRYVDHVEFTRATTAIATAVVPNETTFAGFTFPNFHFLDAFFSRQSYETEFGKAMITERKHLVERQRHFLFSIRHVSVYDYLSNLPHGDERSSLLGLFNHAFLSFAGESGFLGRHRIRINAFMEIGIKVGRSSTAARVKTGSWHTKAWKHINTSLIASAGERLDQYRHMSYSSVFADEHSTTEGKSNICRVSLKCIPNQFHYLPGDHLSVLPLNSDELIQEMLDLLELDGDVPVNIRGTEWIRYLIEYGEFSQSTEARSSSLKLPIRTFLKHASIQPMDFTSFKNCASSILKPCHVHISTNLSQFSCLELFRIAKQMYSHGTSTQQPLWIDVEAQLETLLQPLRPRMYSIASYVNDTPGHIYIYVAEHMAQYLPSAFVRRFSQSEVASGDAPTDVQISTHAILNAAQFKRRFTDDHNNLTLDVTNIEKENLRRVGHEIPHKCSDKRGEVLKVNVDANEKIAKGISSSYLRELKKGDEVRVCVQTDIKFRMPEDKSTPVIMFGLGSGAAPFRSFILKLKEQKYFAKSNESLTPAWLVLGVKTSDHIIFRDIVEDAYCRERSIDLSIAFSREAIDIDEKLSTEKLVYKQDTKKHVQDLFKNGERAEKLAKLLACGAHVYLCGNPELENLVRDVISSVVERFPSHFPASQMSNLFSTEYPERMAANNRFHVDTYYSKPLNPPRAVYTISEVARHTSFESCWVVFRGEVFDISRYLRMHPGGPKILMDKAGGDMTEDFNMAHGKMNDRVASMIQPYKIGILDQFPGSSPLMYHFKMNWSRSLLHNALEYRSVYSLDLNDFPELGEPEEFLEYKSPDHTPHGRRNMAFKFWKQYEPDMFDLFNRYLDAQKEGKWLNSLQEGVDFVVHLADVRDAIQQIREASKPLWLNKDEAFIDLSNNEVDLILSNGRKFHDMVVDACIEIQEIVETSMKRTDETESTFETRKDISSELLQTLLKNIRNIYNCL